MSFKCGLVGLPNVGKSTLFNALTASGVEASNYPFCTIDPNVGVVAVPDKRLDAIAAIAQPKQIIPTSVQFVDIAGLVAGASKGEGLGNQFLAHIRESQAIVHIVRCFENDDITHVSGKVDPISDIEVINTELALADMEMLEKVSMKLEKEVRRGDKVAQETQPLLKKILDSLNNGVSPRALSLTEQEIQLLRPYPLLTAKPLLYVANVSEDGFKNNPLLDAVVDFAKKDRSQVLPICAAMEAELLELPPAEQQEFLKELGIEEPGLHQIIRAGYSLLGFITFFTVGPKELRAWTCPAGSTAPIAAGAIHSDFQEHFIRAEVIGYEDYIKYRGEQGAKDAGKWRLEGKTYVFADGDIAHFRSGK